MKISLKWLNDYVDVSDFFSKPNELADVLTKAGLEVEEIHDLAKSLNHVVVGYIKLKDKHPNADKLSLCQVEIAPGQIEQIVCGAQNHKTGDKVVVALPGAVLPGNFQIKKSKIRDVESNGMLCSFKELGQADTSDGIVILEKEAPVGQSYSEYAGLNDVTFELKVTPNRADCLSHYGLAREIGCLLNRKVKKIETYSAFSHESTKKKIELQVSSRFCNRYSGRYVQGVKVGSSPDWLKKRLESIGMNSINNVVDVTNYVMLELGQPLHAFDADLLEGSKIDVRDAEPAEKFKTLKDQDINLAGGEVLICDGKKAVALAGVIGGMNSGVSEKTQNIFIESAHFDSMSVRKSSRSHGIETDSAYRFSRGVDPSQTVEAMDRVALLVSQVAGGIVLGDHHDYYPNVIKKEPIRVLTSTVQSRLGYPVNDELFEQYMLGLHCEVKKNGVGDYSLTPPLFRFDLEQEMDFVEEYARLNGYDKIQETLPVFSESPTKHDLFYTLKNQLSQQIRSSGFSQAFNYAFTSQVAEEKFISNFEVLNQLGLPTDSKPVSLKNPLSEELNVMRRSVACSLWHNVKENFHMGNHFGKLFELGNTFSKLNHDFNETNRLALASWGEAFGLYSDKTPQVLQIKSAIEKIFSSLSITSYTFKNIEMPIPFLHSGQAAQVIVEGKAVGFIGTVHPFHTSEAKIRTEVALAELNLDLLLQGQPRPQKFKSVAGTQTIERDFSFVFEIEKPVGNLLSDIKKSLGGVCKDLKIFDIYQGDKLDANLKSVSLRLYLQDPQKELDEASLQEMSKKVLASAEKSVGAKLR